MKTFAEFCEATGFEPTPAQRRLIEEMDRSGHVTIPLHGPRRRHSNNALVRLFVDWARGVGGSSDHR